MYQSRRPIGVVVKYYCTARAKTTYSTGSRISSWPEKPVGIDCVRALTASAPHTIAVTKASPSSFDNIIYAGLNAKRHVPETWPSLDIFCRTGCGSSYMSTMASDSTTVARRKHVPGTRVFNWQSFDNQGARHLVRRPMTACQACKWCFMVVSRPPPLGKNQSARK